jgi:hypothetical protein
MLIACARHRHRDAPARASGREVVVRVQVRGRLKGRVGIGERKEERAEGPDVARFRQRLVRPDVKELGRSVGHGRVLGGEVLLDERLVARLDGYASGDARAEIHEDGGGAVRGEHDVSDSRRERREEKGNKVRRLIKVIRRFLLAQHQKGRWRHAKRGARKRLTLA